jgi:hypothetical protein
MKNQNSSVRQAMAAFADEKSAARIAGAIPTEYSGSLVSMTVTATVEGVEVRHWFQSHGHGGSGWSSGITAEQAVRQFPGRTIVVRSQGRDCNRSWDRVTRITI